MKSQEINEGNIFTQYVTDKALITIKYAVTVNSGEKEGPEIQQKCDRRSCVLKLL